MRNRMRTFVYCFKFCLVVFFCRSFDSIEIEVHGVRLSRNTPNIYTVWPATSYCVYVLLLLPLSSSSNQRIHTDSSTPTRHLKHSRVYHRIHSTGSVTFRSTNYCIQFNCAHQLNRTKSFRFPTKILVETKFSLQITSQITSEFFFVRNITKCPVFFGGAALDFVIV